MQIAILSCACLPLAKMSPCSSPLCAAGARLAAACCSLPSPGPAPSPGMLRGVAALPVPQSWCWGFGGCRAPDQPERIPPGLRMDTSLVALSVAGLCRLSDPLVWMSFIQANIFLLTNNLAGAPGSEDTRSKWQWLWSDPCHRLDAASLALFIHVLSRKPANSPALHTASPSPPQAPVLGWAGSPWDALLGGGKCSGAAW